VSDTPRIVGPGEGQTWFVVGDAYRMLAMSDDTAGRYAIFEATVPPGSGPPPHRHTLEAEAFYVLEGEIEFTVEQTPTIAKTGSFVHLPPGVAHAFRNASDRTARMLILVAPGGFERMFFEAGARASDPQAQPPRPSVEEIARLSAAAPRYGIEFLTD
jgi:quercetin dioxygenase-like cupin family protein